MTQEAMDSMQQAGPPPAVVAAEDRWAGNVVMTVPR